MSQASPETGSLTLVDIALDVQILICTLLHPSDILALRETCKALQHLTRQRQVWVAALYHRVCLDNSLFLPSLPILDMSDTELEHAAITPHRWIELSATFQNQRPNDSGAKLRPRTARFIEDSLVATDRPGLFIVPGGRYMVSCSRNGIFVWDLGYTSSADCKLIASGGTEDGPGSGYYSCIVQATPDGMGLIIFSSHPDGACSVYEIYPQNETPQLTRIAHLDFNPSDRWACLLPNRVLWYQPNRDRVIFRVWDYRTNYSISFAADVDCNNLRYNFKVTATKKTILLPCIKEILFWAIPPLLPQPPDFSDDNPTRIPSLFSIAYPYDTVPDVDELIAWHTVSHGWYCGSLQPLYFSIFCWESILHTFEIIVKPNLFDTSLHIINTEVVPHGFHNFDFETYRICEGTFVAWWEDPGRVETYDERQFRTYTTGLRLSRFTTAISHGGPAAKMSLPLTPGGYNVSLCPASGRYVHLDNGTHGIFVVDIF